VGKKLKGRLRNSSSCFKSHNAKNQPEGWFLKSGAGNEIRTRDPNLGKAHLLNIHKTTSNYTHLLFHFFNNLPTKDTPSNLAYFYDYLDLIVTPVSGYFDTNQKLFSTVFEQP